MKREKEGEREGRGRMGKVRNRVKIKRVCVYLGVWNEAASTLELNDDGYGTETLSTIMENYIKHTELTRYYL